MCGIAGISLAVNERVEMRSVAKDMLLSIESRGRDATGAAWFTDGNVSVQKDGLPAKQFVANLEIPNTARTVILHTRAQTQGSSRNNDNNHPVITGGIVGVHNGGIMNDSSIFARLGGDRRIAQVDTEAIFAAIAYGTEQFPSGNPKLGATLEEILGELSGSAAIAWIEVGDTTERLHLARLSSSPLLWTQSKNGSFFFASTKEAIESAAKEADVTLEEINAAPEGTILTVRNGVIEECRSFEPHTYSSSWRKNSAWSNSSKSHSSGSQESTLIGNKEIVKGQEMTYPFMQHTIMHSHLAALLTDKILTHLPAEEYHEEYKERENEIEEFLETFKGASPEALSAVSRLNGFCRPGDWVRTDLGKATNLSAQIVTMPQEFPVDDEYILKVYVPNSRYPNNHEAVLVARKDNEFILDRTPSA